MSCGIPGCRVSDCQDMQRLQKQSTDARKWLQRAIYVHPKCLNPDSCRDATTDLGRCIHCHLQRVLKERES